MNQREANIIAKLVKIAEKQQKIISGLVQKSAQNSDPMAAYLNRAAGIAGLNNGVQGAIHVTADGDGTYTVQMTGAPDDNVLKQKVIDEFYATIDSQKPELSGKVNLIF